jgi:hypothetical protein
MLIRKLLPAMIGLILPVAAMSATATVANAATHAKKHVTHRHVVHHIVHRTHAKPVHRVVKG